MVRIIDTVETDSYVHIATERVVPLSWDIRRDALNVETIKWGLYSTAVGCSSYVTRSKRLIEDTGGVRSH